MKNNTPKYLLLISIFSLFLSSCGGSDSTPPSGGSVITAPVITIQGSNPINLYLGTDYTDLGATAVDSSGGALTVSTSGIVDTEATGTYQITYQASDTSGNITTATRTVHVTRDTTAPVITITGSNPINLALNTTYNDLGATAVDSSGDIPTVIIISNNVATDTIGTYQITYQASDTSGNIATATRTVNVTPYFNASATISSSAINAISVFAIDLDGDGYNDVLSASEGDNKIAWYKNDGTGVFSSAVTITTSAAGAISVFAIDIDGDGDNDVLSASLNDNKIAWYKNNGSSGFASAATISTSARSAYSVFAIDLDGDGDNDVLSASIGDNKIAWYKNNGSGSFASETIISGIASVAVSVFAIDLDGDGDNDVLYSTFNGEIAWYRNNGSETFSPAISIRAEDGAVYSVYAIDLDGDGDNDVLSALYGSNKIVWYENTDGRGAFASETIIDASVANARSVFAIDLDGDGDNDIIATNAALVLWYENNGDKTFSSATIISDNAGGGVSAFAIDLDADSDNDVLVASYSRNQINWHENAGNEAIKPPSITLGSALNTSYDLNVNISTILTPTNTGGYIDTWSITPALNGTPSFNTSSGALYGTYDSGVADGTVEHRITATNAGGSDTITVNIKRPAP